MKLKSTHIKNYKSIQDSGIINFSQSMFVLAGQNESGKSSILDALHAFEENELNKDTLNFGLENTGNLVQEISCTYTQLTESDCNEIYKALIALIKNELTSALGENHDYSQAVNLDKIKALKGYSIIKSFDYSTKEGKVSSFFDKATLSRMNGIIGKYKQTVDEGENPKKKTTSYLPDDLYAPDIIEIFWKKAPLIVLINDFKTTLPDSILIEELENNEVEGIEAVKNLEAQLSTAFEKMSLNSRAQKNAISEKQSEKISVNFQTDWNQKIFDDNKVKIKFSIENNDKGKKEIQFFVETKDNEYLAPRKRSKGMIWFLSLWLELKAKENGRQLVLLFDEPGLHLHIKANKDMLKVFHKLVDKGHQVIYSTHSPSLIEPDLLSNIGLIINNKKKGTLVEELTTSKINTNNKRDALQPIAEAMGMEPAKDFSILKSKNVLVEGLSDYWYFKGMQILLQIDSNYEFIPGIGIKNNKMYPLISFCIGYGLEWLLIMDNGKNSKDVVENLESDLFEGNKENLKGKLKLIDADEIENMLAVKDLIEIDSSIKEDDKRVPIKIIGQKRKILFSKIFYKKVKDGEIKKSDIQTSTLEKFKQCFKWIKENFK